MCEMWRKIESKTIFWTNLIIIMSMKIFRVNLHAKWTRHWKSIIHTIKSYKYSGIAKGFFQHQNNVPEAICSILYLDSMRVFQKVMHILFVRPQKLTKTFKTNLFGKYSVFTSRHYRNIYLNIYRIDTQASQVPSSTTSVPVTSKIPSASVVNQRPHNALLSARNRGCVRTVQPNFARSSCIWAAVWGCALSCKNRTFSGRKSGRSYPIAHFNSFGMAQ